MTDGEQAARKLYDRSVPRNRRRQWFAGGSVPVAVYGLGKMGLPLAAVFAETTGNVIGIDIDDRTVERINDGDCPVENEPGLPELVSVGVETGALRATTDAGAGARAASVHVVVVPTTVTEDSVPDLSTLQAAVESIAAGLDPGDVVLVESTVPPGTCREVVHPTLVGESDCSAGEFGLAFCPERTASGRAIADIRGAYPKVVGGVDGESRRVAELVYGELTDNDVISTADATTAECVKVFEGVYRDVNIALANELARLPAELGVDAVEAIEVANTQPFCDIHDPGAGVGGHCIPYYPYFLIHPFKTEFPLLATAREVNDAMPEYVARLTLDRLVDAGTDPADALVAVLGVTYRPGVAEIRESPAVPIVAELVGAGATTVVADPVVGGAAGTADTDARAVTLGELSDLDLDGAVLVTAHEEFDRIDWTAFDDLVVVDGRDSLTLEDTDHDVYTVGRG